MTIGRPNGNAWIGKPLDLLIPLQLDSSESGDGLCLEADVLQGDARFDDKRVTISLEPGAGPDAPRVRLRTTRAVEEPVVTVKLTAGCVTKSTRQYVLLADLPEAPPIVASPSRLGSPAAATNEGAASAPAFVPPVRPSRPARTPSPSTGRTESTAQGEGTQAPPPSPQPRRRVVPVPVTPPAASADDVRKPRTQASKPAAAQAPAPKGEPKSRLQIEALSPEQQAQLPRPGLGSTGTAAATGPGQLAGTPAGKAGAVPVAPGAAFAAAGTELTGATAAAALAAATEQNRRDAERLKELETALATLREQSAQTQRQLLELRGSLAQAEATRYRDPVIYGLLALLALALIGLVLLWRQARQARLAAARWNGASEDDFAAVATKRALPRHGELADDDEDDDDGPLSAPADVSGLRSAAQGLRVTALPAGVGTSAFHRANVRPVNAEELFDVQQQSEFFVSLGQHEQAIGVLREHIAANPATSAMSYLDLLGVLQSVGRREDYAAVAREFSQRFNMDVPAFGHFSGGGHGIEHYQAALQRVADKWPSQGTAELIEELVFRKPTSTEECFELPAYQDLLLLYAVARDLSEHEGAWAVPTQVSEKPPVAVPPGHGEHPYQQTAPMPYLPETETSMKAANAGELGPLELDLSDLDRTAFETLRAPIEPNPVGAKPPAAPSIDPHVIDFDPFDPETNQGDLRPRHLGVKR